MDAYIEIFNLWSPELSAVKLLINSLTADSAKSKTDKFSKLTNWVKLKTKHHSKVLLSSFPMNGHT